MTTSDPTNDEEFCSRCAAGVDSPEHHEKCVVTGFAEDGESASDPRETEHIECDCVPDIGPSHCHLCSERAGHPVPWSEAHPDGAPGDHAELIARLGELAGRLVGFPGWHDVHDAIAALRTEQSARQALMECPQAIHGSFTRTPNGKCPWCEWEDLRQRIDAMTAQMRAIADGDGPEFVREFARNALTAPTESKEPAPKLDPWPIATGYRDEVRGELIRVPYYAPMNPFHRFLPRPEFSQNPADYGIEAPHE